MINIESTGGQILKLENERPNVGLSIVLCDPFSMNRILKNTVQILLMYFPALEFLNPPVTQAS